MQWEIHPGDGIDRKLAEWIWKMGSIIETISREMCQRCGRLSRIRAPADENGDFTGGCVNRDDDEDTAADRRAVREDAGTGGGAGTATSAVEGGVAHKRGDGTVRRTDKAEARWRVWRSEPAPRLDGEALLARTEQRLHAFCRGDRCRYDATVRWPMTQAQREAVRKAAGARTGAERLRAIADVVEVSPYFDWFASAEALDGQRALDEAEGGVFSERLYRAFDRPDLEPGTYTKANVGLIGPKHCSNPPLVAVCADPKGWAAVLWGHERNRWGWEDTDHDLDRFIYDAPEDQAFIQAFFDEQTAKEESGEWIDVTFPAVGVSFFTSLRTIDGGIALNAAAARLLELDETQVQWLGASAWEGGPYWDTHASGQDLAEVCRAVARGEDARDAWYARRVRGLDIEGYDRQQREDEEARDREAREPELSRRLSVLVDQALAVARRLDRGVYRPNARVLHRWNPTLERCDLDVAGLLLAGPIGLGPRAGADEAWHYVLDNPRTTRALRALRQVGLGEVHEAVTTLGSFEHADLLEAMTVEPAHYEGWREAEAHFNALEAVGRRLKALGL